jgi:hypothetical protein
MQSSPVPNLLQSPCQHIPPLGHKRLQPPVPYLQHNLKLLQLLPPFPILLLLWQLLVDLDLQVVVSFAYCTKKLSQHLDW